MNSRLRWRSLTSAWTLPVSRSIPANRLSVPWRLVLMIPREARMAAWHWRQIRCRRGDGLDSRLLVVRDDRDRLLRFLRAQQRLFSGPGPRGVDTPRTSAILGSNSASRRSRPVAHLVRLISLLTEKLAHGALSQTGETLVTRRPVRARYHGGPKAVSSTVHADSRAPWPCRSQRYQPGLGLRRDRRLFARSRSVIKCRKRAIGHRSLDAALHRLMMHAKSSSHGKERWLLPIAEQHRCPRHPACRFGPRPRQSRQCFNLSPVIANATACRHPAMMRSSFSQPQTRSANKLPVP